MVSILCLMCNPNEVSEVSMLYRNHYNYTVLYPSEYHTNPDNPPFSHPIYHKPKKSLVRTDVVQSVRHRMINPYGPASSCAPLCKCCCKRFCAPNWSDKRRLKDYAPQRLLQNKHCKFSFDFHHPIPPLILPTNLKNNYITLADAFGC